MKSRNIKGALCGALSICAHATVSAQETIEQVDQCSVGGVIGADAISACELDQVGADAGVGGVLDHPVAWLQLGEFGDREGAVGSPELPRVLDLEACVAQPLLGLRMIWDDHRGVAEGRRELARGVEGWHGYVRAMASVLGDARG